MNRPPAILILCTGNSCRSHLAEAVLRERLGDAFRVESAGSRPAGYVHPLAIRALAEIGIDIGHHRSKHLDEFLGDQIETVITVCGNADRADTVSIRPRPWSLVTRPTRKFLSSNQRLNRPMSVVFPAPRKPPIRIIRRMSGVGVEKKLGSM